VGKREEVGAAAVCLRSDAAGFVVELMLHHG